MAGKTDGSSADHHHDSASRDRERRRRGSSASEFCERACRTRNQNPDGTSGAGINWERVDGGMSLRLVSYLIHQPPSFSSSGTLEFGILGWLNRAGQT